MDPGQGADQLRKRYVLIRIGDRSGGREPTAPGEITGMTRMPQGTDEDHDRGMCLDLLEMKDQEEPAHRGGGRTGASGAVPAPLRTPALRGGGPAGSPAEATEAVRLSHGVGDGVPGDEPSSADTTEGPVTREGVGASTG